MIRLVLFDIDGTLIRTGGAGVGAFARTGEIEFGIVNGVQHLRFAGRTDTSLVREFLTTHRIEPSPANFHRFFERYVFLLDHLLSQHQGNVCPGVSEFIAGLHTLDEPPLIGLQTGNIRLGAEIKLRHFGLWEHVRTGAFGDDHEDRNRLAAIACERGSRMLGKELSGSEILFIGDTPADIECGRAVQARVLAVGTGGATLDELRRHRPDWAVPDLTTVQAATVCR